MSRAQAADGAENNQMLCMMACGGGNCNYVREKIDGVEGAYRIYNTNPFMFATKLPKTPLTSVNSCNYKNKTVVCTNDFRQFIVCAGNPSPTLRSCLDDPVVV
jgi:hypothetical protein